MFPVDELISLDENPDVYLDTTRHQGDVHQGIRSQSRSLWLVCRHFRNLAPFDARSGVVSQGEAGPQTGSIEPKRWRLIVILLWYAEALEKFAPPNATPDDLGDDGNRQSKNRHLSRELVLGVGDDVQRISRISRTSKIRRRCSVMR